MTEPTTPQLTEREVYDLESSLLTAVDGKAVVHAPHVAALIRDWRALQVNLQHEREAKEAYKTVLDRREEENAALREQLAEAASSLGACQRRRQDRQELINELQQTVRLAELTAQTMAEIGDEL